MSWGVGNDRELLPGHSGAGSNGVSEKWKSGAETGICGTILATNCISHKTKTRTLHHLKEN